MKYLIDTNIFIIILEKSFHRLSTAQRDIIFDATNELMLSEASLYEIAIKVRLTKPDFSHIDIITINRERKVSGIKLLKSQIAFYINITNVPKVIGQNSKPHGDPFDLLIISQALLKNIPILSTDRFFPLYSGLKVIS